jgi:hypothetical protein
MMRRLRSPHVARIGAVIVSLIWPDLTAAQGQFAVNGRAPEHPNLSTICGVVSSPELDPGAASGSRHRLYHSAIYRAAGVSVSDGPSEAALKIQVFWNRHSERLRCNTLNFDVPNGHLLKFAVARRSDFFLRDVVHTWRLDLNFIDHVDGRTVLDYIAAERARTRAPAVFRVLDRYYRMFREAGAKHRSELP